MVGWAICPGSELCTHRGELLDGGDPGAGQVRECLDVLDGAAILKIGLQRPRGVQCHALDGAVSALQGEPKDGGLFLGVGGAQLSQATLECMRHQKTNESRCNYLGFCMISSICESYALGWCMPALP
jgi:hypothetical protein